MSMHLERLPKKGRLISNHYRMMVQMIQEEKNERRFQSLRDVGKYWDSTKYLLPRTQIYDGPRKSPMSIYFNMRRPQKSIPMHSPHMYIRFCAKRNWKLRKVNHEIPTTTYHPSIC